MAMDILLEDGRGVTPPGRTWEAPQPFFDEALAVRGFSVPELGFQAPKPTKVPGFAELSGCVKAMSDLFSAQEAARAAVKAIASVAIAAVSGQPPEAEKGNEAEGDALAFSESPQALPSVSTSLPQATKPPVSVPATSPQKAFAQVPDPEVLASVPPPPCAPTAVESAKVAAVLAEDTSPRARASGAAQQHGGIFTHRGAWVCPGMAKRRLRERCVALAQGDHAWSSQLGGTLPQGSAGHGGVVKVLGSLPSPRLAAPWMARSGEGSGDLDGEILPSAEDEVEQSDEMKMLLANLKAPPLRIAPARTCGSTCNCGSGDMKSAAELDGDGGSSPAKTLALGASDSAASLVQAAASAADTSDDVTTTAAGDTEEPSERSFMLHADASMASLISVASHQTGGTFSSGGGNIGAGHASGSMALGKLGTFEAEGSEAAGQWEGQACAPTPPAGLPPARATPSLPPGGSPPQKPGFVPVQRIAALRSLYGGRVPRPWSKQRGFMGERLGTPRTPLGVPPRTPRTPRTVPPLACPGSARKPAIGGGHSEQRFHSRHLAALAAVSDPLTDLAATAPPKAALAALVWEAEEGANAARAADEPEELSLPSVPPTAPGDSDAKAQSGVRSAVRQHSGGAVLGVDSMMAPLKNDPVLRRRDSDARASNREIVAKGELPPPAMPRYGPLNFRNEMCPFSDHFVEDGVVLNCGHRFSVEHLGTAIASAQRMDMSPAGFLVCPMCGDARRYGPDFTRPIMAATGRLLYPTIYSDTRRANHGANHAHLRNWDAESTLPVNV